MHLCTVIVLTGWNQTKLTEKLEAFPFPICCRENLYLITIICYIWSRNMCFRNMKVLPDPIELSSTLSWSTPISIIWNFILMYCFLSCIGIITFVWFLIVYFSGLACPARNNYWGIIDDRPIIIKSLQNCTSPDQISFSVNRERLCLSNGPVFYWPLRERTSKKFIMVKSPAPPFLTTDSTFFEENAFILVRFMLISSLWWSIKVIPINVKVCWGAVHPQGSKRIFTVYPWWTDSDCLTNFWVLKSLWSDDHTWYFVSNTSSVASATFFDSV